MLSMRATSVDAQDANTNVDYTAAEQAYAAAAQRDPKKPDLQFNVGTAAYKAGQFPQAAEAFQKSLDGIPSADPKRLAAQEDAYYDLGNTLYRSGQKTEPSNAPQTIQTWEQAVKTYDAALQLRANDTDAKYNRDLVQRKLEELKKQQQQQNQKQNQDQKQDQQNKSAQNSGQKNQQNKDQKSDQQNQSGQNSQAKNQENQNQKSGAGSKPDQQKDQQQANSGSKPDQQKQPDQNGQQPQPANGQPQGNAQAQAGANPDQNAAAQAADSQVEPGQMSKADAQALLDSVKNEEQRLPTAPVARNGNISQQSDQPIKDW